MPRIDRRAIGCRLFLIGRVPQNVVEVAVVGGCAEVEFTNCISRAITRVITILVRCGVVWGAGVGRFGHPYPDKSHRGRTAAQSNCLDVTFSIRQGALRKRLPDSMCRGMHGI